MKGERAPITDDLMTFNDRVFDSFGIQKIFQSFCHRHKLFFVHVPCQSNYTPSFLSTSLRVHESEKRIIFAKPSVEYLFHNQPFLAPPTVNSSLNFSNYRRTTIGKQKTTKTQFNIDENFARCEIALWLVVHSNIYPCCYKHWALLRFLAQKIWKNNYYC